MDEPILHFSREELAGRRAAACAKMAEQGLDGLVMFRQESMYYLTGYDTMGYTMFQALYLGADGDTALITRTADRIQSRETSVIDDIRMWYDRADATPAEDMRDMLEDKGCRGKRLGIEYHAYGLTAQRGKMVDAALDGFCETVDASDLVRLLRLVKSPAELDYTRKAGELCDLIFDVSVEGVKPGASTKAIFGQMVAAQMAAGGDPAASRYPSPSFGTSSDAAGPWSRSTSRTEASGSSPSRCSACRARGWKRFSTPWNGTAASAIPCP